MPARGRSRIVRLGSAGGFGPLVIIGMVAALAVLMVVAALWDPCPEGTERRCGTTSAGKLVGHACECVDT